MRKLYPFVLLPFLAKPERFESPWVETSRYIGHAKRVFWFVYRWKVWARGSATPELEGFAIGLQDAKARIHHEILSMTAGRQRWTQPVERRYRHLRQEGI